MMDINKIYDKLKHYDPILHVRSKEYIWINNVRFLKENNTNPKQSVLYILDETSLIDSNIINTYTNIFIIGNSTKIAERIEQFTGNLIIITKNICSSSILEEIDTLISDNHNLIKHSLSITDTLLQGKGIQHILDKTSKILNKTLFLYSPEGEKIAYSINKNINDKIKEKINKENNNNFSNLYDQYRELRIFEKVHKSKTPFYFYGKTVTDIVVNNSVAAYLIVYENEYGFNNNDIELISFLKDIINLDLQYNKDSSDVPYKSAILHLLKKDIKDPFIIEEKVELLNSKFRGFYNVLSIKAAQNETDNTIIPYICKNIECIVENSLTVPYKNQIVVIIPGDRIKQLNSNDLRELILFLSKNCLYAGLSRQFNVFENLWEYYTQSLQALELGFYLNEKKIIYDYEDYIIYQMIGICSEQTDIRTFCSHSLLKLLEYDKKNNTNYIIILYTYIMLNENKTKTADKFNIYRKTVSYKLKKIKELVNIDLNDKEQIYYLYLSLKILKYLGEID